MTANKCFLYPNQAISIVAILTNYKAICLGRAKAIFPENKDFRGNLITPFSSCFSKNATNIYYV